MRLNTAEQDTGSAEPSQHITNERKFYQHNYTILHGGRKKKITWADISLS
jgi:hypothetical protein